MSPPPTRISKTLRLLPWAPPGARREAAAWCVAHRREYGAMALMVEEVAPDFGRLVVVEGGLPEGFEEFVVAFCGAKPQLVFASWPTLLPTLQREEAWSVLAAAVRAPPKSLTAVAPPAHRRVVDRLIEGRLAPEALAALCERCPSDTPHLARHIGAAFDACEWRVLRVVLEQDSCRKAATPALRKHAPALVGRAADDPAVAEVLAAALLFHALPPITRIGPPSLASAKVLERGCSTHPELRQPATAARYCRHSDRKLRAAGCRVAAALFELDCDDEEDLVRAVAAVALDRDPDAAAAACRALGVAAPRLVEQRGGMPAEVINALAAPKQHPKAQAQAVFAIGNVAKVRPCERLRSAVADALKGPPKVAAGALRAAGYLADDPAFARQLVDYAREILSDSFASRKVRRNACSALGVALPKLEGQTRRDAVAALLDYVASAPPADEDDRKALSMAAAAAAPAVDDLPQDQLGAALAATIRAAVGDSNLAMLGDRLFARATPQTIEALAPDIGPRLDSLFAWLPPRHHDKLAHLGPRYAPALDRLLLRTTPPDGDDEL